jgi:FemAB-related protein (PEP-CTERM system-associated)
MQIEIRQPTPDEYRAWDAFVLAHPRASPFHLTAWKKSIEEVFHYRPMYLLASESGTIRGVLPLFLVKSLILGKTLISSPFAVYGGILADSVEVRDALAEHVKQLGASLQVEYVELRNAYQDQCIGFAPMAGYVALKQRLVPDESALLESIPRKTRRMVRKALESSLTTAQRKTTSPAFEDLYSRNLRRLGTPSFPSRHFAALVRNFGEMVDIREVVHEGRVIAAVMTFYFRDQVLPYYGASDPQFNSLAPNNYMYFDLMRWAGQNGYTSFDFGRSKKISGSYDFKSHWGMEEVELPYEVLLVKRKSLPNFNPNNPRFQLAIKIWQRLPLPVTRALGPELLRLIP